MNTLLKTLSEKYGSRSAGEQEFIDTHRIEKIADRNGNKDDVFNGNVKKANSRLADQKNVDDTGLDHVSPIMKRFYDIWGASGGYGKDSQVREEGWINFGDNTSINPGPVLWEAIEQVRSGLNEDNLAKFDTMLRADMSSYEQAIKFVLKSLQEGNYYDDPGRNALPGTENLSDLNAQYRADKKAATAKKAKERRNKDPFDEYGHHRSQASKILKRIQTHVASDDMFHQKVNWKHVDYMENLHNHLKELESRLDPNRTKKVYS